MRLTGYTICLLLLLAASTVRAAPRVLLRKGRTADTARLTLRNLPVHGGAVTRSLSMTLPVGLAARLAAAAPETLTASAIKEGKRTRLRVTAGYGCNAVIIERDKDLSVQLGAGSCTSRYRLTTRATKSATPIDPVSLGRLPRGARTKKWYASELRGGGERDPHAPLGGGVRAQSATLDSSLGRLAGELSSKPFGTWKDLRTTPQVRDYNPAMMSAVQTLERVLHATYTTRPSPLRLRCGEVAEYSGKTGDFGHKGSSIVPDPSHPWHKVSVQNKACTFFTDVKLQLKPGDDLKAVAQTLALGRSVRKVEQALKRHVRAGRTEIPLQELLPSFVQQNHNTYPDRSTRSRTGGGAPNCFNAALGFCSSRATPRYTSPAQFASRLRRSYKLLQPGEQIRFGDVVVVWSHSYNHPTVRKNGKVDPFVAEPIHAAVYLDKNLLFGKASISLDTSYQFEPYAGSFAHYLAKSSNKGLVTVHRRRAPGS